MKSFSSDLLSGIRQHLEGEKREVVRRIENLSAQDPYSFPDRTNDNSALDMEATEESNHDRYAALASTLHAQLSDIDEALVRIGDGTYGFCSKCHKMIDTDRLAILPTATLCLLCEQKKPKKN